LSPPAASPVARADLRRRTIPTSEARPPGRNARATMNSSPWKYVQAAGNSSDSAVFAQATATAPSTAPTRLARPPTAAPMTNSIDGTMPIIAGEMMPTAGTNSAPASPAMPAATTYATSFTFAGSYPRKRTRSSESRTATRSSP
jgi:hypothetical protein